MTPPVSIGKSVPHDLAVTHACGRSLFIDDIPPRPGELVVDFVGSPVARGRLRSVDSREAADLPGVVAILTSQDIPGERCFGAIVPDEPFLAEDDLLYVGQPVALIAAETREAAAAARRAVRLDYIAEEPTLTIADSIRKQEFIGSPLTIQRGDAEQALAHAELRLEGVLEIGGQEHFYLETQGSIAVPGPGGEIRLKSSTQYLSQIQTVVARMLGLGMHEVVVESCQMGGAFGGKETQAALPALMAALVARHTGRPARAVLDRPSDMQVTGKRHQYEARWQAGFDSSGSIDALDIELYSNGGCAADLSPAVMERSLFHAENAYFIPNIRFQGQVCRTNLPSNTAFRGFGGPQAIAAVENLIEEVAAAVGKDALAVRRHNCYGGTGRNTTPYGQQVDGDVISQIMDRLAHEADYASRLAHVENFNQTSLTHLRGISLIPVKFGISFTKTTLNQANALVNVFPDGTVQVSTGATEMGQGVNTKIRQLVADELGIPLDDVRIMPASTEKNHNASATAASVTTDLNGMAALDAARRIKSRLAESTSDALPFADRVRTAYENRIDLGARGFFATPDIGFDWVSGRGRPFRYFTVGCAISEVLVDRHTGSTKPERADILIDAGRPINPAIERGQVIGGFVQGMGYATSEELCYDGGRLTSDSPSTYKIPTMRDIPKEFNVAFFDAPAPQAILASKGVGEPPLVLGLSVWTAVKHALSFVRPGVRPRLDLPATPERVLIEIDRIQGVRVEGPIEPKPVTA